MAQVSGCMMYIAVAVTRAMADGDLLYLHFYVPIFWIPRSFKKFYWRNRWFYSSKSKIPVWPFLILSCFGGAYALLPYFVLWRPPPPPIEETELSRWPLNFLESKLTAGVRNSFPLSLLALPHYDLWGFFQLLSHSGVILEIASGQTLDCLFEVVLRRIVLPSFCPVSSNLR